MRELRMVNGEVVDAEDKQVNASITSPGVFPATCLECGTVLSEGDKCDHFDATGGSLSMRMGE